MWLLLGWIYVCLVVAACLIRPPVPVAEILAWGDKLVHGAAFAGLMWWFALAHPRRTWPRVMAYLWLLGVGIEFAQALTPYREASVADVGADSVGLMLGLLTAYLTPAGFTTPLQPK